MKVICIDNKNPINHDRINPKDWIYEGEVYTVIEEIQNKVGLFYQLAERDNGKFSVIYHSRRFLILSDIDEFEVDIKENKFNTIKIYI